MPKECSLVIIYYAWGTDTCLVFTGMVSIFSNQSQTWFYSIGYFIKLGEDI
jgi:hypothetical protein